MNGQDKPQERALSQPPVRWPCPRAAIRVARRATVAVLAGYLAILGTVMFFEERLIFFPARYPEGDWHPADLVFEDVEFQSDDGIRLHGWYCPVADPRAVVLFSHGNAGNITHRAYETLLWQEGLGVSVFMYDYRGYGRSAGNPTEGGTYADARGAYRWLAQQRKVSSDRIVLRGRSLGGAVSLQLALEVPHLGLILENSFTSASDMGQRSFPWLPVRWLIRNHFDSLEKIGRYHGPLLITHGTQDTIVPFEMAQRLFRRGNEPKWFHAVPGADHNDLPPLHDPGYFAAISEFLEGCQRHAARAGRRESMAR